MIFHTEDHALRLRQVFEDDAFVHDGCADELRRGIERALHGGLAGLDCVRSWHPCGGIEGVRRDRGIRTEWSLVTVTGLCTRLPEACPVDASRRWRTS